MDSKDAASGRSLGPNARSSGFTLIELIVATTILVIVLALGTPSFYRSLADVRRSSAVDDLVTALSSSRSTAITRRLPVTICRSLDGGSCAGGGSWQSGWISFVDENANGNIDKDEAILRRHGPLTGDTTVFGNTHVSKRVTFRISGATANNGRFAVCDRRGLDDDARIVVISVAGRIRAIKPSEDGNTPLQSCMP